MSEQPYPVLRSKADTKSETYEANRAGNLEALRENFPLELNLAPQEHQANGFAFQ